MNSNLQAAINKKSSEIPGLGSARTRTESKTESVVSKNGFEGMRNENDLWGNSQVFLLLRQ